MKIPDKITITPTATEKAAIAAWVKFYRDNPQYIGVPRPSDPLPPALPGGGYPWQTRIVWDSMARERFDEISAQFPEDTATGPVIDPPGPLGRFDAAPSNWGAWRFITDEERRAMEARYPAQQVQIVNLVQFYAGGSAGGIAVNGLRKADGSYWFWKLANGTETLTQDTGGAADAYIADLCNAQGRPLPGHLR